MQEVIYILRFIIFYIFAPANIIFKNLFTGFSIRETTKKYAQSRWGAIPRTAPVLSP